MSVSYHYKMTPMQLYKYTQLKQLHLYARQKADHVCKNKNYTQECAITWDLINDYERAMRKIEVSSIISDPLDDLCEKNKMANMDECRIYG